MEAKPSRARAHARGRFIDHARSRLAASNNSRRRNKGQRPRRRAPRHRQPPPNEWNLVFGAYQPSRHITTLSAPAVPCRAEADLKLPREKVTLVAPPFVHPHEQATKSGPKIIEFTMTAVEKPIVIDEAGTTIPGFTYNGSIPGPLMVVGGLCRTDARQPRNQHDDAYHRFPCGHGSAWGSRTNPS
jgi:hypothetical protein